MDDLTQSKLQDLVIYNPVTGLMNWVKRPLNNFNNKRCGNTWNSRFAGKEVGSLDSSTGYLVTTINDKDRYLHRLAWFYVYGVWPECIDHINHNKTDNRICNLRSVIKADNAKNFSLSKNNKSGVTGVIWHKKACKWQSYININKRSIYLGLSQSMFDAVCLRRSAENKYNFHENHGK